MPRQRLSMRRIKQLLTMRFGAGASARSIAQELGIAPSTVREYLSRAAAAGIVWPLAADVTDESLMARLFVNAGVRAGARHHAEPDWAALVREFKRPCSATAMMAGRIASPEMLPRTDLLPHLKCSRPGFGGDGHEADQHDNTGRVGAGGVGALWRGQPGGAGPHPGRACGGDGLA